MTQDFWQKSRGDLIAEAAWRAGDHRPRCNEGHLICRGCGVCVCHSGLDAPLGASETEQVRVQTDREGHTWCQECRYEYRMYGNYRGGCDVDDRDSLRSARYAR